MEFAFEINRKYVIQIGLPVTPYNYIHMQFLNIRNILIIFLTLTLVSSYLTFDEFKIKFDRNYSTSKEEQERRKIYQNNVNNFRNSTFEMAVNNLTDRTPEEIAALKNLKQVDVGARLGKPAPLRNRLGYPLSMDWRDSGAITSVKSQGSCGACWSFAAAALAESKVIIDKRFTNTTIDLSEQFLLSCTDQSSCRGGYLEYSVARAISIPSETVYPYSPYSYQDPNICSAQSLSVGKRNANYYNLTDNDLIALLQAGPVAISIYSGLWEFYGSGIFACSSQGRSVDHAVLLVGYTANYWIVKNQWGSSWGIDGYIHVTRNTSANCNIGYSAHIIQGNGDSTNDRYFVVGETGLNTSSSNSSSKTVFQLNIYLFLLSMLACFIMLL